MTTSGTPIFNDLLTHFVADLLGAAAHLPDDRSDEQFEQVILGYIADLGPWLRRSDFPFSPRPSFQLFTKGQDPHDGSNSFVQPTPEGLAFFRAWLRREGYNPDTLEPELTSIKGCG